MDTSRWSSQSTFRVFLLLIAAFLFGVAYEQGTFHRWFNATSKHERAVQKYDRALRYIEEYHVDEHDPIQLTREALRAISDEQLDRYSSYLDPETYNSFSRSTEGEYVGLGIKVSKNPENGFIEVVNPFRGSPAMKHNMKPGDFIVAVEGTSTEGLSLEDAISRIKGPEGSSVTITVRSGDKERTITLKRSVVDIPTVAKWGILQQEERQIGYITVRQFSKNTVSAFRDALRTLMNRGIDGLIIDLRFNPGGLLQSSVQLADLFLKPDRTIVTVRERGRKQNTHTSRSEPLWTDGPVTILVNEHSASASEVFAGALRDHGVATLVGTRTHGKGSVQQPFTFPGERDALKLTVARYYTPSGKTFDRSQLKTGEEGQKKAPSNQDPSDEQPNQDDRSQAYGLQPDVHVEIADTKEERRNAYDRLMESWQEAASTEANKQLTLDIHRDPQLQKAIEVIRSALNKKE